MSAPVSHHPLVVNTADGACWKRRAVTSDGRGLYALAGAAAGIPDEVLTSLADLAELGITGSAFALPMPVGAEPRDVEEELIGANLSLYEEELENARLRLALKSAQRGRRELRASLKKRTDLLLSVQALCRQKMAEAKGRKAFGDRLRARVAELEAQRQADHKTWQHDLRTARDEREATAARIAESEAERHTTNEALDDAVQALRADRAEPAKGPTPDESADRLTAFFAPVASLRDLPQLGGAQ